MIKRNIFRNVKIKKSFLKKHAIFIILSFTMLVVFLLTIQPTDIYNMKLPENKAIIILILSFNYAFNLSIELLFLNRKTNNKKRLIRIHILFSLIIVFTSIFILYIRHPYMTKYHFLQYLSIIFVIVIIFQLLFFFLFIGDFTGNYAIKNSKLKNNRVIITDNKTTINLDINDIIYIKSEGNYATVYEKNKKYLIRTSLKKILEQNSNSELIRCHKSYIVNSNKIKSISGNSKGYKISLLDYEFEIPVSVEVGKKLKSTIR